MINTYEQVYRLWRLMGWDVEISTHPDYWARDFEPKIPEEEIKAERGEER